MAELSVGRDRVEAVEEKNGPGSYRRWGTAILQRWRALRAGRLGMCGTPPYVARSLPYSPFSGESLSGLVSGLSLCASSAAPIESGD